MCICQTLLIEIIRKVKRSTISVFLTYCYKLAVYGCGVQSIQKDQNIFFGLVSFPAKSKGNWD